MEHTAPTPPSARAWNARWKAVFLLLGLTVCGHILLAPAQRHVQVKPEGNG